MSAFADKKKKKKGKGKKGKKGGKGGGKGMAICINSPDNQIQRIGAINGEFISSSGSPILVDDDFSDSSGCSDSDESSSCSSTSGDSSFMESENDDELTAIFNLTNRESCITSTSNKSRIYHQFNQKYPGTHIYNNDSHWYTSKDNGNHHFWKQLTTIIKNHDLQAMDNAIYHVDESKRLPIDMTDRYFKTPLMLAAGSMNLEFVRYLLENGADVNKKDQFKWTALHHACSAAQPTLRKPNNSKIRPKKQTAQEKRGLEAIALANQIIAKKPEDKSNETQDTAPEKTPTKKELPSVTLVKYLIQAGADIEAKTFHGATPLIRAIQSNSLPVVHCLIENGANIMAVTEIKKKEKKKKKGKKGGKDGGKGGGKGGAKKSSDAGSNEKNVLDYATEWADIELYDYIRLVYEKKLGKGGDKKKKAGSAKPKPKTADKDAAATVASTKNAEEIPRRLTITPAQRERNSFLEDHLNLSRSNTKASIYNLNESLNGKSTDLLTREKAEGSEGGLRAASRLLRRAPQTSNTLLRSVNQLDQSSYNLVTKKKFLRGYNNLFDFFGIKNQHFLCQNHIV